MFNVKNHFQKQLLYGIFNFHVRHIVDGDTKSTRKDFIWILHISTSYQL